eukprot:scaffold3110_cov341-Prasinococcus_capsulatus_cf.AAC.2
MRRSRGACSAAAACTQKIAAPGPGLGACAPGRERRQHEREGATWRHRPGISALNWACPRGVARTEARWPRRAAGVGGFLAVARGQSASNPTSQSGAARPPPASPGPEPRQRHRHREGSGLPSARVRGRRAGLALPSGPERP